MEDLQKILDDVPLNDEVGVRMAEVIVQEANRRSVSDVHLTPRPHGWGVAMRHEGRLRDIAHIGPEAGRLLVGRIKVLCRLPASDDLLPRDGAFFIDLITDLIEPDTSAQHNDETVERRRKHIEVRASFFPVLHGQRVVLRLPLGDLPLELESLGYPDPILSTLRELVSWEKGVVRDGMFLMTGPAGSGKTTTLYALLAEMAKRDGAPNVMTLEDPVEREVPGILQTSLQPQRGFDYPEAIRSVLRQDPDVILLGEIRDPLSAQMSCRLALTGHLLLATLHSGRARRAVERLEDLGVERYLWKSTLQGVLAQRLVESPLPTSEEETAEFAAHRRPITELWLPESTSLLIPPGSTPYEEGHLWRRELSAEFNKIP